MGKHMSDANLFIKTFSWLKVLRTISTFSNSFFISLLPNGFIEYLLLPLTPKFHNPFAFGEIKEICDLLSKRILRRFDLLPSGVSTRAWAVSKSNEFCWHKFKVAIPAFKTFLSFFSVLCSTFLFYRQNQPFYHFCHFCYHYLYHFPKGYKYKYHHNVSPYI